MRSESSWQSMRLAYIPQLLSALVWCWETVVQSLWMPWEGEEGEVTYRCLHRWGFGDCQFQCTALSFIVLCENERLPARAPVCDESGCNSCGCKVQYVNHMCSKGQFNFSSFNTKHNNVFKWILLIIILYWYSVSIYWIKNVLDGL